MKKILTLLAFFCLAFTTAFAEKELPQQPDKFWQGDIARKGEFRARVGGFWGYSDKNLFPDVSPVKKNHQDDWFGTFEVGGGYNFTNNWYLGVDAGFWWKVYPFNGVPAGNAVAANLVLDYRLFNQKRWQFFAEVRGGGALGVSGDRIVGSIKDDTPNSINLEVMPGVLFRLRENIDLTLGIGYQHLWNRGSLVAYDNENGIVAKVGINIRKRQKYAPAPVIVPVEPEPVVEPEPAPEPAPAPVVVEEVKPCIQNVFFLINRYDIRPEEMEKVEECVAYLNKYPEAKIDITGYADKNTGNATINLRLSKQRVNAVYDALIQRGIAADRINKDYKGDTVQPFGNDEANYRKNRCTICVAE